jgi:Uncharacterised protein conserved in bacteria (DUF2336)
MTTPASLIDDLERTLEQGNSAQCAQMLARVTDLFFAGGSHYSADQLGLFDEVIGRLAAAIEPVARAKLAARLAPEAGAPAGVIRMLAFDDNIQIARPILTTSPCLKDEDLVANANSKSQRHLVAIAERKNLSEAVTDVLVARGDQEVAYSVSGNPSARFSYAGFRTLLRRSIGDDRLAMLIGSRGDLPRQHFLRLIEQASATVRQRLLAESVGDTSAVEGVVGEISSEISSKISDDLRTDVKAFSIEYKVARALVERMHRAGTLSEAAVRRFATERRSAETAVALTLLCQVEDDIVERALLAPGSDILVILAKLAGFSWETAKAILMLKSGDGAHGQNFAQAKASFERLQADTARHVLGFYRARRSAAG